MSARQIRRKKQRDSRRSQKRKFLKKKHSLVRPGRGLGFHQAILGLSNHGVRAGFSRDYTFEQIREIADEGTRDVPDQEIWDAVDKAYDEYEDEVLDKKPASRQLRAKKRLSVSSPVVPKKQKRNKQTNTSISPEEIAKAITELTANVDISEAEITTVSPVKVRPISNGLNQQLVQVLEALYEPSEYLVLTAREWPGVLGANIRTVEEWKAVLRRYKLKDEVVYIIPNPVTGGIGLTKTHKESYRCDAAISSGRYAVMELDDVKLDLQVSLIAALKLPISAVIFSGGKSYHLWIDLRILFGCELGLSQSEWDEFVIQNLKPKLVRIGADPATFNRSRLSRIPGHYRQEKNEWQRLVYLNPAPAIDTNILQLRCLHE